MSARACSLLLALALVGPVGAHAFAHHAEDVPPVSGGPEIHGTGCEHGTPDDDAPPHDCSLCHHRKGAGTDAVPCARVVVAAGEPDRTIEDEGVDRAAPGAQTSTRARAPPAGR